MAAQGCEMHSKTSGRSRLGVSSALLLAGSFCLLACGGRSESFSGDGDVSTPAAVVPWTALSHTPPPAPRDDFTWVGSPATFSDVWSDSSERAWVVATQSNYKGPVTSLVKRWEAGSFQVEATEFLYSATLSGLAAADLWLGAGTGVEHRDGATWTPLPAQQSDLISETAPNDVWSCCLSVASSPGAYQAAHWDGAQWTPLSLPVFEGFTPTSLFARGHDDVWIAGTAGYLLHHTGSGEQMWRDASVQRWNSVWGDAQTEHVWTVGSSGAIARWDSASAEQRLATENVLRGDIELTDVWGSAPDTIWAVGTAGTILSFDGSTLALEPSGTTVSLLAVWGAPSGVIWAAGAEETLLMRQP